MLEPHTLDPVTRRQYGAFSEILERGRRPTLPDGLPYALLAGPGRHDKMRAFATLDALARHIDRQRTGFALDLRDARMFFAHAVAACPVIAVTIADPDTGAAIRFLGYACLNGGGVRQLKAALHACAPERAERVEWQ